jgi:hypothetical protein
MSDSSLLSKNSYKFSFDWILQIVYLSEETKPFTHSKPFTSSQFRQIRGAVYGLGTLLPIQNQISLKDFNLLSLPQI